MGEQPLVFYKGQLIEDMSREELIEALRNLVPIVLQHEGVKGEVEIKP